MDKKQLGTSCSNCGRVFSEITELRDVHSVGIALFGTCNKCGTLVPCEKLWHKHRTLTGMVIELRRAGLEQIGTK